MRGDQRDPENRHRSDAVVCLAHRPAEPWARCARLHGPATDWTAVRHRHTLPSPHISPIRVRGRESVRYAGQGTRRSRPARRARAGANRSTSSSTVTATMLEVRNLSRRFGGLVAVSDLSFSVERERDSGPDRAERRGQDHYLQRHQRLLRAERRPGAVPGRGHLGNAHERHRGSRPGENVSGHHALPGAHGHRERARRVPPASPFRSPASPARLRTGAARRQHGTRRSTFSTSSGSATALTISP